MENWLRFQINPGKSPLVKYRQTVKIWVSIDFISVAIFCVRTHYKFSNWWPRQYVCINKASILREHFYTQILWVKVTRKSIKQQIPFDILFIISEFWKLFRNLTSRTASNNNKHTQLLEMLPNQISITIRTLKCYGH